MSAEHIERYKLMIMTKVRQQQAKGMAQGQLMAGADRRKKKGKRRMSFLVSNANTEDGGKSDRAKMAGWIVSYWTARNVDGLRIVDLDERGDGEGLKESKAAKAKKDKDEE